MTRQLGQQRQDLMDANAQLDHRRRFTESVLAGVSAGVLGLDEDGRVDLPNRSALELLNLAPDALIGRPVSAVLPELGPLLGEISRRPSRTVVTQIQLSRAGEPKTLLVRIVAEREGRETHGYVVTFDDITELLSAQRKAAWADVARRIAHEIKNPLTPIQLSAERLRRRYLKEIQSDPEVFTTCIDTIIRHVGDIGRMVSEFSEFARMPAPVFHPVRIEGLLRETMTLQKSAHPHIRFAIDGALDSLPPVTCDENQVNRALTNVVQNAIDAIEGRQAPDGEALPPGEVTLTASAGDTEVTLAVADNGRGLPVEDRDRLTEPYVTTRAKGTGLGLAIVKKIMEDHGGRLALADRPGGGALAVLSFPTTGVAGGPAPRSPAPAPSTAGSDAW
jgi:two-component system nitrogen regulation sensor histidine kinase NtrY